MSGIDQKELDRQWILKFAGETTAWRLDHLRMNELVPFEELLERNGVNTDLLSGSEMLADLVGETGLFSRLYEVNHANET